jgi:hypothetical protein
MRIFVNFVIWVMFILPSVVFAQGPGEFPQDLSKEKREKIKAYKIGYLTEKLSLTPEEAARFWPVYNEFQEKKQELWSEVLGGKKADDKVEGLSDEEVEVLVDDQMRLKEKMLSLERNFHVKVKEMLPIKKVYLLGKAERGFKREIIKRIRKKRGKNKMRN